MSAPLTVLVADDEPVLLELLVRMLERVGHQVLTAPNGDAALEAFEADPEAFDIVVLDLNLPPAGALVLARDLLARARVGVVVTSGNPAGPEARALLEEINGRFLQKPFPPALFIELIEAVRPGRAA